MKKAACYAVAATIAVMLLQAAAFGAVTVTWDGGSVELTLIANPDASNEYWWPQVWYGELPISMTSLNSLVFTGTGNFNDVNSTTANVIRLKQVVTNNTTYYWNDFHIRLSNGMFYKKWIVQNGWNASLAQHQMNYYMNTGSPVAPGGIFTDGVVFTVATDSSGNGSFTLTKWR